jgi:1,4-alpha-glucan branching enzyme
MFLIDHLHQNGIGVILDWVPSHFPNDEHGLGYFDGTHLYEHGDPRQGIHPDWNSFIFNFGRHERHKRFTQGSARGWLNIQIVILRSPGAQHVPIARITPAIAFA